MAWKLRTDPRVILKERTNIRYLKPEDLYTADAQIPDLGVMDVSFISLTKVLPAFWALLQPPREVVLLVKPQFEVGQDRIGKKGVVRDPVAQGDAIATVLTTAKEIGWHYAGLTWSPAQDLLAILSFCFGCRCCRQQNCLSHQSWFSWQRTHNNSYSRLPRNNGPMAGVTSDRYDRLETDILQG